MVRSLLANAGDIRDMGLIPGSGRSSGGRHGNPLQYSYLENPVDRGAWRATVHGISKGQTRLKGLSCAQIFVLYCCGYNGLLASTCTIYSGTEISILASVNQPERILLDEALLNFFSI